MMRLTLAAFALAVAPLAAAQPAPGKKLYCWTEGARKVCGDALPATAVDSARTEINALNGLATSRVGRAPTAAERAAMTAAEEEEGRARLAAEAEVRRVMAMVQSFETEDALRRAFDNRISLNRDSIKTARMGLEGIRAMLADLLRRAGEHELDKRRVPKHLADSIREQHAMLVKQTVVLDRLEREAALIRSQLDDAVARYRAARAAEKPARAAG